MQKYKYLLSSLFIATSSLVFANNSQHIAESSVNTANMITIQPHTRSVALNAKHSKLCEEQGGVDISDSSEAYIGKDVIDAYTCIIHDKNKFDSYLAVHKIKLSSSRLGSSYTQAFSPSGYFATPTYTVLSAASFSRGAAPYDNYGAGYGLDIPEEGGCISGWRSAGQINENNPYIYASVNTTCRTVSSGHILSRVHADRNSITDSVDYGSISHPDSNSYVAKEKNNGYVNTVGCNLPSSYVGNPINITVGNKFQRETDIRGSGVYPLVFERFYNSTDNTRVGWNETMQPKGWSNTYSAKLLGLGSPMITLEMADGHELRFYDESGTIKSSPTELGSLRKIGSNYEYTSPWNEKINFNGLGKLTSTTNANGLTHSVSYDGDKIIVKDQFNHALTITNNDNGKPINVVSSNGQKVSYEYDAKDKLIKAIRNKGTITYHYENKTFLDALTGITDERGVRYAIWTYDGAGRANSSYHAGETSKVSITYNSDTQTTLTNSLNRTYIYSYKIIDGIKRITKIQGNASSQCPAIGTSYEYDNRGLVTSATDGKGIKTQYDYNDAGQEISRTVGVGTAEAVTIKSTWDTRFNLLKTEIYPDKVITFDYDSNGNLIDQTIKAK